MKFCQRKEKILRVILQMSTLYTSDTYFSLVLLVGSFFFLFSVSLLCFALFLKLGVFDEGCMKNFRFSKLRERSRELL